MDNNYDLSYYVNYGGYNQVNTQLCYKYNDNTNT
jgi:hypothetical protein